MTLDHTPNHKPLLCPILGHTIYKLGSATSIYTCTLKETMYAYMTKLLSRPFRLFFYTASTKKNHGQMMSWI